MDLRELAEMNTTWAVLKIRLEEKRKKIAIIFNSLFAAHIYDFHIITVIYSSLHGFNSDQLVGLLAQLVEHCTEVIGFTQHNKKNKVVFVVVMTPPFQVQRYDHSFLWEDRLTLKQCFKESYEYSADIPPCSNQRFWRDFKTIRGCLRWPRLSSSQIS